MYIHIHIHTYTYTYIDIYVYKHTHTQYPLSLMSLSDFKPLSEIISFSNRFLRVSLSTWLSMTCEVKR